MKKKFIIALVGKSASGKTSLFKELTSINAFKQVVTTTTRPIRDGEKDGVDYYFVSQEEYQNLKLKDRLIAERVYKEDWYYAINKRTLSDNKPNLVIVDPAGLKLLQDDDSLEVHSIYLDVPREIRLIRSLERGDQSEEILRRMKADDRDFKNVDKIVDEIVQGVYDADVLRAIVLTGVRQ